MKMLHVFVIGAMAFPPLALADAGFDAGQLGHMKGVLGACARIYPQEASAYLLQMKALIGNATKNTVNQATESDAYQQAYQAVTSELGSMGQEDMARACAAYLAPASRVN